VINGMEYVTSVNGPLINDGGAAKTAQEHLALAMEDAGGRSSDQADLVGDLGGQILAPGVYFKSGAFAVTGILTFDAQNNENAVWILRSGGAMTTAADSKMVITNGGRASNIFFKLVGACTLGARAVSVGTIMASTAISLGQDADHTGGLLAKTAAVTLDSATVTATGYSSSSSSSPAVAVPVDMRSAGSYAILSNSATTNSLGTSYLSSGRGG
jgi:hypothetical protein